MTKISNSSNLGKYRKSINSLSDNLANINTSLTNSINNVKNTYLPLQGGTITGNLTVNNMINNVQLRKVSAKDFTGFESSFRTMLKGDSNYDAFVIPFRTGTSGITGLPLHGAALGFGVDDVQLYISGGYSSEEAWIGGGNADKINWKRQIAFKGDYATSVGGSSINKPAVVKETYKSGDSWYRVYSDGWIEQGGAFSCSTNITATTTQVTFIKAFTSSVNIIGGFVKSKNSAAYGQLYFQNGNTTLTGMVCSVICYNSGGSVQHSISGGTGYWYACGY